MLMYSFYNGAIHNHESKRPAIGSICYKLNKDYSVNDRIQYELVNIFMHGGKYDSYQLVNVSNGKTTTSKLIATKTSVSITNYSELISASVSDGYGNIDFEKLRHELETCGIGTIKKALALFDQVKAAPNKWNVYELLSYMMISPEKHTGKMHGMHSLSTSVKLNPLCKLNQHVKGSICQECYAENMQKNTAYKHAFNTLVLCTYEIPADLIPDLHCFRFRYESFSDMFTETQIINYMNIALANPETQKGIFTKRPELLHRVLIDHFNGIKPKNLSVVVSSLYMNVPIDIKGKYMLPGNVDMVDHVFTVYTAKYAIDHDIKIQCLDSHCIECGICYQEFGTYYVNEIVKSEQKLYKDMLVSRSLWQDMKNSKLS